MTNKDNIRLWVDALRSGQYVQGHGALRPEEGLYCCLGVACEVAGANGIELNREYEGYADPHVKGSFYSGGMPQVVTKWLGLKGHPRESSGDLELPEFPHDPEFPARWLAAWNDEYNADFNQIADIIERNLLS